MANKIAIFIDQANLWRSCKSFGKLLDDKQIKPFFEKRYSGEVSKMFYYRAIPNREGQSNDKLENYFFFLKKQGFSLRTKTLKSIVLKDADGDTILGDDGKPLIKEKGNFDVEIVMDMLITKDDYDIAVLFSGDSDFLAIIDHLMQSGKEVHVFSSKNSVSHELKTGASSYTDISELSELHGNPLIQKKKE